MGDLQNNSSTGPSTEGQQSTEEQQQGQQPPAAPAGSAFEAITSQEEFDARIAARLSRERAKFSDYDALKNRAANFSKELDEAKAAGKQEAQQSYTAKLLESAVRVAATSQGFHDPADAWAQFGTVEDAIKDGDVDSSKINSRLTEIATNKPYLIDASKASKVPSPPKPKQSGQTSSTSDNDGKKTTGRAAEALRNFSRSL